MIITPKIKQKLAQLGVDEGIYRLFPDFNCFYQSQFDEIDDEDEQIDWPEPPPKPFEQGQQQLF